MTNGSKARGRTAALNPGPRSRTATTRAIALDRRRHLERHVLRMTVIPRVGEDVVERAAEERGVDRHAHALGPRTRRPARSGRGSRRRCAPEATGRARAPRGGRPRGPHAPTPADRRGSRRSRRADARRRRGLRSGSGRSRAISTAMRARPSGERSSWLMAASSSRCSSTTRAMRSAMPSKARPTSRTSSATQRRGRPSIPVRAVRSPEPKRSAVCARCSSGRASRFETRRATAPSTSSAAPSATPTRQSCGAGDPVRSSSAPTMAPPFTTGT